MPKYHYNYATDYFGYCYALQTCNLSNGKAPHFTTQKELHKFLSNIHKDETIFKNNTKTVFTVEEAYRMNIKDIEKIKLYNIPENYVYAEIQADRKIIFHNSSFDYIEMECGINYLWKDHSKVINYYIKKLSENYGDFIYGVEKSKYLSIQDDIHFDFVPDKDIQHNKLNEKYTKKLFINGRQLHSLYNEHITKSWIKEIQEKYEDYEIIATDGAIFDKKSGKSSCYGYMTIDGDWYREFFNNNDTINSNKAEILAIISACQKYSSKKAFVIDSDSAYEEFTQDVNFPIYNTKNNIDELLPQIQKIREEFHQGNIVFEVVKSHKNNPLNNIIDGMLKLDKNMSFEDTRKWIKKRAFWIL